MTDNMQDIYTLQIRRHGNPNSASPYCEACKNGYLHVNSLQVRQFTQTGKLPGVCKSCNIAFLKICRLQIRHLTQTDHQPHVCPKCSKSFTHAGNYKKHMLLHEKEAENPGSVNGLKLSNNHPKPPFKCEKCDRTFLKYGSFIKHCINHDMKHRCEICEKVFNTKQLLKGHMYSHKIEQHAYVCKLCKHSFTDPEQLEEHLIKHVEEHNQTVQENKTEQIQNIDLGPVQHPEAIQIPATGSWNPTIASKHVQEMGGEEVSKESEEVPSTTLEQVLEVDSVQAQSSSDLSDKYRHFCSICSKGFVNLGTLKNHFSKHTGDLRYQCKKCNRKFMHAFNLKRHARTHKYRFVCKVCNQVFSTGKQLKTHSFTHKKKKQANAIESEHVPETNGKEVSNASNVPTTTLKQVLEVDSVQTQSSSDITDKYRHFCTLCSKGFVNLGTLKNHFMTHTGDLRYQCRHCNKKFLHSCHLKSHALTHKSRFLCKVCNQAFSSGKQLKTHSFTHKKKKQTNGK